MNMKAFRKSFEKEDNKRRDSLPLPLLELEKQASKKYFWIFSIHYPWNHPSCHFKNTITFTADGFPMFRLRQLNDKFTRFKMVQYRFRGSRNPKIKYSDPVATNLVEFLKSRKVDMNDIPYESLMEFFKV